MLPAEEYLLGVDLNIDLKNTKLILQDKSGILDSNLSVVDWRNVAPETEKERFETMQRLGDQIC